jgi:hypothetical protein
MSSWRLLRILRVLYVMSTSSEYPGNAEFTREFFDQSSAAWMENKIRKGAMILYRCVYVHSSSRKCTKAAKPKGEYCSQHTRFGTHLTSPDS